MNMYVCEIAGRQYVVTPGQTLTVNHRKGLGSKRCISSSNIRSSVLSIDAHHSSTIFHFKFDFSFAYCIDSVIITLISSIRGIKMIAFLSDNDIAWHDMFSTIVLDPKSLGL